MKNFRTRTTPGEAAELADRRANGELVPEQDGREIPDPRPVSVPVKVRVQGPTPLEAMYAEIRMRERLAREAAHQETPAEALDFDVPDELEELISDYEEIVMPEVSVLGEALKDPRVYKAIESALRGRYGPVEAAGLQEMAKERSKPPETASAPGQAVSAVQPDPKPDSAKPLDPGKPK